MAIVRSLILIAIWLAAATAASAKMGFYDAAESEIPGTPGTIVRQEPLNGAPEGAAAYRVLYRSTSFEGKPIAVSGVVIVPRSPPPPGGRPIVAWAHPTSGIARHCAPSLAIFFFRQVQGLRELLARGYIVTATDYPGLGTPGPHPYLVGASEGRAVLDSVRAARLVPGADAGDRFAVWGHSQGGQAALFAGSLAGRYAPELHLVGVAAAAPATELATLLRGDLDTMGGNNLAAMTLWSWQRVFGAPMDRVVYPSAIPAVDRLAGECIESIFDLMARERTSRPLQAGFLSVPDPTAIEPWRSLTAENTPGMLPAGVPVFVAQGTADRLVRPAVTHDYVNRLCAAGSRVELVDMPGVTHAFAGKQAAPVAVAWMAERFADRPAPDTCSR